MDNVTVDVLCEHPNNANTYLIKKDNFVIMVDPANDIRSIKMLMKNYKLSAILLTHGHYDHFKTLSKILKEYNVKCYMHKKALLNLKNVDLSCARFFGCNVSEKINDEQICFVNNGVVIEIESLRIKCLYMPGHTDCSMVYIIDDMMFSGDFLFREGIGRFDLPTSDFGSMKKSLIEIVRIGNKQDYVVYPGHGDLTTLSYEIKNNPYLLKR